MAAPLLTPPSAPVPAAPPTVCALDLITDALRDLGVISAMATPSSQDAALGLTRLNQLLGTWAIQRLTIPGAPKQTFPLIANKATYTIGPGAADWPIARPTAIQAATIINTAANSYETPMAVLSTDRWASVGIKSQTSTLPWALYDDQQVPIGTITIYPIPSVSTLQVGLYIPTALQRFPDLSTLVALGDGVEAAIVSNLAVRLARPFNVPLTPDLVGEAAARLADVKRLHVDRAELLCDPAFAGRPTGGYDIYSDLYRGWRW
jgi:hypothetical protein